uniref:Uncharacterized protein n=1 Tax=viral metagenome TaxID=1070528 RepID=A0A6H1ZX06_9ZZZZ
MEGSWRGRYSSVYAGLVIQILEKYYQAIVDRSAQFLHPSLGFNWSDEKVNKLVKDVEQEIEHEIWMHNQWWENAGYTRGPGLNRLPMEAKRAMCEELEKAVKTKASYPQPEPKPTGTNYPHDNAGGG